MTISTTNTVVLVWPLAISNLECQISSFIYYFVFALCLHRISLNIVFSIHFSCSKDNNRMWVFTFPLELLRSLNSNFILFWRKITMRIFRSMKQFIKKMKLFSLQIYIHLYVLFQCVSKQIQISCVGVVAQSVHFFFIEVL